MKKSYMLLSAVIAFLLVVGICIFKCGNDIAVVDVAAVVNHSEQVKALREEQTAKAQELNQWLQEAQNKVEKEKDKNKKEDLMRKYSEEFNQKRQEVAQRYSEELKSIDDNITATITEYAKKKGYKLVIAKSLTIYGGKDITDEITKLVK